MRLFYLVQCILQEEYKTINVPIEMNKKNEIGDNVKIIIADDHLME